MMSFGSNIFDLGYSILPNVPKSSSAFTEKLIDESQGCGCGSCSCKDGDKC